MPPYIFAQVGRKKREILQSGRELIDLGMGDPDLATPTSIVEKLCEASKINENQKYPPYQGIDEFREAVVQWMDRRFSVRLDAQNEVINLIGSKEGIYNFTQAFVNPGDHCLIPDPGYPVYTNAVILAGGTPVYYPLLAENKYVPNWSDIPDTTWEAAKIIFINFPNNPTSATVSIDTYRELVAKALKHEVIICSDNAYSEMCFDEWAPALLQVPEAKEIGIETFSLSKTYNMTGWRVGFAAGNADMIKALFQMKSAVDTGIFKPIQWAAIEALSGPDEELVNPSKEVFSYRKKFMTEALKNKGYEVFDSRATFYLWSRCPVGMSSMDFCDHMLNKGVVTTPGIGFGQQGEGYFRLSLTLPEEKLRQALDLFPNA